MMMRFIWLLGVLTSLCVLGCASNEELERLQGLANSSFTVGDYSGALSHYEVLATSEDQDSKGRNAALIRSAQCLYETGDYDRCRSTLESIEPEGLNEVQWVTRQSILGMTTLALAYQVEPVFGVERGSEAYETGRKIAITRYLKSLEHFGSILRERDAKHLPALLGQAECTLRIGEWDNSIQYLRRSRTLVDAVRKVWNEKDLEKDQCDEMRLVFLEARLEQALYGTIDEVQKGLHVCQAELTERAIRLYLKALKLDRDGNFDFHVAYRDLLLHLAPRFRDYASLKRAFSNSPGMVDLADTLITHMRDYIRGGKEGQLSWYASFDRRMESYVDEYFVNKRLTSGSLDYLDDAVAMTKSVNEDSFCLETYRNAMRLLELVPEPIRDQGGYKTKRSIIQIAYVTALMNTSEDLAQIGEWKEARELLADAFQYSEEYYLGDDESEAASRNLRCQLIRDELDSLKRWADHEARTRALVLDGNLQEAQRQFEQRRLSVADSNSDWISARSEALKNEIESAMDEGSHQQMVALWRAASEAPSEKAPQLLEEALEKAESLGVNEEWIARLTRELSKRCYEAKDPERCLQVQRDLAMHTSLTTDDKALGALCCYSLGQYAEAVSRFEDLPMAVIRTDEARSAAGLSYLSLGSPNKARLFLELVQDPDEYVTQSLRDCYWTLSQRAGDGVRDREDRRDILVRLLDLDGNHKLAQRELGMLLLQQASEEEDTDEHRALYVRAYAHLKRASALGESIAVDHPDEYGRLAACCEDYAPIEVGRAWVYRGPSGSTRTVRVESEIERGEYVVTIQDGNQPATKEKWIKDEQGFLIRFDSDKLSQIAIPIRLKDPRFLPKKTYEVGLTSFESSIRQSGVSVEAGGVLYDHCLHVVLSYGEGTIARESFLAPGVGEVKTIIQGREYYLIPQNEGAFAEGVVGL